MREQEYPSMQIRVRLFGKFQVEQKQTDGIWEVVTAKWEKQARHLLSYLLCAKNRKDTRSNLIDALWPDSDSILIDKYLHNAVYYLRQVLGDFCITPYGGKARDCVGYELVDSSVLWVDLDEVVTCIREASMRGGTTIEALPWLEQADTHIERGALLEGESSEWCIPICNYTHDTVNQCRQWLTEIYERQGKFQQAREQIYKLLNANPENEGVKRYCEEMRQRINSRSLVLPSAYHPSTKRAVLSSFSSMGDGIIIEGDVSEQGGLDMDQGRRRLLQQTINATNMAIILPTYDRLYSDTFERFLRVLKQPSHIDTTTLDYLDQRTTLYWSDRNKAILAPSDLLSYAVGHFQKLTQFLEGSLLPSARLALLLNASKTALLIGTIVFDIGDYVRAREALMVAIKAAQEANATTLQALGLGWMSFTWTYSKDSLSALACIEKARSIARGEIDLRVQTWLAAVEAEIRAHLHDSNACLAALNDAEKIEDMSLPLKDDDLTQFDVSRLAGYKGASFRKLYDPKDEKTRIFLEDAQTVLKKRMLSATGITKLSGVTSYMVDFAWTLMMQGEVVEACNQVLHVLDEPFPIKSHTIYQRLVDFRRDLAPWKDILQVKDLDERLLCLGVLSQ